MWCQFFGTEMFGAWVKVSFMNLSNNTMKVCSKCHISLARTSFCVDRKTKDGLFYWCRLCVSESRKRVTVTCGDCGFSWKMRTDNKFWTGRCKACARKQVALGNIATASRPKPIYRNNAKCRKYVETTCGVCGAAKMRRADMSWNGRCHSCASKESAKLDYVKKAMRQNGIAVMNRVGKLPHYGIGERRGTLANNWRGGITPENAKIRASDETKAWRIAVFERDDYTCQVCGDRGGNKHADHIKPFALFPELRFDVSNGRTLCIPCHRHHGALVFKGRITREASGLAA